MSVKIRQFCLSIWNLFDPLYSRLTRLDYIEKMTGDRTIIRIRTTKYKGRTLTLSDGTIIYRNDLLLKIHLHNVKLLSKFQNYSEVRRALIIYRSVQDSLPCIAHYIQLHKHSNKIKGLIGITALHKGCNKLGFEQFCIHNPYYKVLKQVAHSFIYLLSTNKIFHRAYPSPMYLLMSKNYLFNKYKSIN